MNSLDDAGEVALAQQALYLVIPNVDQRAPPIAVLRRLLATRRRRRHRRWSRHFPLLCSGWITRFGTLSPLFSRIPCALIARRFFEADAVAADQRRGARGTTRWTGKTSYTGRERERERDRSRAPRV